jgi:hypothetical protein
VIGSRSCLRSTSTTSCRIWANRVGRKPQQDVELALFDVDLEEIDALDRLLGHHVGKGAQTHP